MGDESYPVRIRRVLTSLARVQLNADHAFTLDGADVSSEVYALVEDEGFARFDSDSLPRVTGDGEEFLGRAAVPMAIAFLAPEEAA